MPDHEETSPSPSAFDFSAFPPDTLFLDRRTLLDRRAPAPPSTPAPNPSEVDAKAGQRRARKDRRRRIDPTTFEKQYTSDEMEFMTAVQRYKVQSGKAFPSHSDILRIAHGLGYRQVRPDEESPHPELTLGAPPCPELIPQ